MLVRAQPHLGLAVNGPHPRVLDLDATTTERHLPVLVTVSDRGPVPVVLPLQTDDLVDLLHQFRQDTQPDADAERQQPFLRYPDQLAQSFLHALREHDLIAGRLSDRYVATHGGSSLDLWRIAANAPKRSGRGRRDRRDFKVLRRPGQPPRHRQRQFASEPGHERPGAAPQCSRPAPLRLLPGRQAGGLYQNASVWLSSRRAVGHPPLALISQTVW